jgi:DHA2 family multidrug resistance protein
MAMAGAGQVLFLIPSLIAGGMTLKPSDGPTASLLFNATTLGGTSIGVALATELVTERQMFHLGALAESAAASGSHPDRLDRVAAAFASRIGDDAVGAADTIAAVARALSREAWVLSFNDGFLLVGSLLIASGAGVLLLKSRPPLGGATNRIGGSS